MQTLEFPRLGDRCYFEMLPNGLPVYVHPRAGYSKAFVFFAVHYGGEDIRFRMGERWRQTPEGTAHYLEHKMFDMPDGNAMQTLSARGASPNAFTSSALTGYYFSCTDQIDEDLRILLRTVTTPYFTEESVAKEQGIIAQEIRMVEDDPDQRLYQELLGALYASHPIRTSVAGTVESISHITPAILEECHRAFYRPSNMVLCVAGDVDPRQVMQIAAATVPPETRQSILRDHGTAEQPGPVRQEVSLEMEVSAPSFLLGCKADPDGDPLRYRLIGEIAAELLVGESSPLYARLYQDGLIDKSFGVGFDSDAETAHFIFGGESKDPNGVAEAILNEAVRLAWDGPDEALFRRIRKAAYGARVRALNSFDHTCVQLARAHFAGYRYLDFADLYDQITAQEVVDLLRGSVTGDRSALSIVRPKGV